MRNEEVKTAARTLRVMKGAKSKSVHIPTEKEMNCRDTATAQVLYTGDDYY